VKLSRPALLIIGGVVGAAVAVAVTLLGVSLTSSAKPGAAGAGNVAGSASTAAGRSGTHAVAATLSSNPVCQRFEKDVDAWKTAVDEPDDTAAVLLNVSTRPAWRKFGRELDTLSKEEKAEASRGAARTAKVLARTSALVTKQGTEPFRRSTGAQYQQTVTDLQEVTGYCTVRSR